MTIGKFYEFDKWAFPSCGRTKYIISIHIVIAQRQMSSNGKSICDSGKFWSQSGTHYLPLNHRFLTEIIWYLVKEDAQCVTHTHARTDTHRALTSAAVCFHTAETSNLFVRLLLSITMNFFCVYYFCGVLTCMPSPAWFFVHRLRVLHSNSLHSSAQNRSEWQLYPTLNSLHISLVTLWNMLIWRDTYPCYRYVYRNVFYLHRWGRVYTAHVRAGSVCRN